MTDMTGVTQHPRAMAGEDPRGILVFSFLPPALDNAENSTAAADFDRRRLKPRGFTRDASAAEVELLQFLGYQVPAGLQTVVMFKSKALRHRSWPALQEVSNP